MYTPAKAHADSRHASPHPDDRAFWRQTCTDCALLYDKHGLPVVTVGCTCGARDFASCLCNITPRAFYGALT